MVKIEKIFVLRLIFFILDHSISLADLLFKNGELIFDYGIQRGDNEIAKSDTEFNQYDIGFRFPYLNTYYEKVYISQEGYIGFQSPDFYINIYRSSMSNKHKNASIFYQSYVNRTLELETLGSLIQDKISDRFGIKFHPLNAYVITWSNLTSTNQTIDSTVTFQVVLISDEFRSFIIFSYGKLGFSCSEVSLRHITNYISLPNLDSINQNSNIDEIGVYIFEVNANFVCEKTEIIQNEVFFCSLYSNQTTIFKIKIQFCGQDFTAILDEAVMNDERFNFALQCSKAGLFELQIVEIDQNSIVYKRKISIVKYSEKLSTNSVKFLSESQTITTEIQNFSKNWFSKKIEKPYELIGSIWLTIIKEIKSENLIQFYYKTTENINRISLLKEIRIKDLMQCLIACQSTNGCEKINFEDLKCKMFNRSIF